MILQKKPKIPENLEAYIKSNCSLALKVKRRIYREWYSDIRNIMEDIKEIEYLISIGAERIDDEEEYRNLIVQMSIYKNLLKMFGQDPDKDPEYEGREENDER